MRFLIVLLAIITISYCSAQDHFAKSWFVQLSGSYAPFKNEGYKGIYHEGLVEVGASFSITKALFFGGHGLLVLSKNSFSKKNDFYFIGGLNIHYNLLPNKRVRLLPELAYSLGDYCSCEEENPHRRKGLHYLGVGFGAQFPLIKTDRLYFNISFMSHFILNRLEEKSVFHRYKVGLVYRFGQ